jgi:hypothetical protein
MIAPYSTVLLSIGFSKLQNTVREGERQCTGRIAGAAVSAKLARLCDY